MKLIRYGHETIPPIAVAMYRVLRVVVARLLRGVSSRSTLTRRQLRFLRVAAVVFTLGSQAILMWLLFQAIELSILLMEVWAELAAKHLEITLDESPS